MPCWAGASPVAIDVSAVAVVDGATVVIAPPVIAVSRGITAAWSCNALHPRPSSTSTTTASASSAGFGIHELSTRPNSAGTIPAIDAPSSAGSTGSTPRA